MISLHIIQRHREDLKVIRFLSGNADIKLVNKVKKASLSTKNIEAVLKKNSVEEHTIQKILEEMKTPREESTQSISLKVVPLKKEKEEPEPTII